jgi:hypothetical protein
MQMKPKNFGSQSHFEKEEETLTLLSIFKTFYKTTAMGGYGVHKEGHTDLWDPWGCGAWVLDKGFKRDLMGKTAFNQ